MALCGCGLGRFVPVCIHSLGCSGEVWSELPGVKTIDEYQNDQNTKGDTKKQRVNSAVRFTLITYQKKQTTE